MDLILAVVNNPNNTAITEKNETCDVTEIIAVLDAKIVYEDEDDFIGTFELRAVKYRNGGRSLANFFKKICKYINS